MCSYDLVNVTQKNITKKYILHLQQFLNCICIDYFLHNFTFIKENLNYKCEISFKQVHIYLVRIDIIKINRAVDFSWIIKCISGIFCYLTIFWTSSLGKQINSGKLIYFLFCLLCYTNMHYIDINGLGESRIWREYISVFVGIEMITECIFSRQ